MLTQTTVPLLRRYPCDSLCSPARTCSAKPRFQHSINVRKMQQLHSRTWCPSPSSNQDDAVYHRKFSAYLVGNSKGGHIIPIPREGVIDPMWGFEYKDTRVCKVVGLCYLDSRNRCPSKRNPKLDERSPLYPPQPRKFHRSHVCTHILQHEQGGQPARVARHMPAGGPKQVIRAQRAQPISCVLAFARD